MASESTVKTIEADAHLFDLLDRVERGETIVITRRGVRVATIVPVVDDRAGARAAGERLMELKEQLIREGRGGFTLPEIIEARDAGRK